jgi:ATP-dependent DNA helicase RecQ
VVALQEQQRRFARTRLEMSRQYADTGGCRRAFLLSYFGEILEPPCETCDNCCADASATIDSGPQPFPLSTMVAHPVWGDGEVIRYEGDTITVLFAEEGYRTMVTQLVLEEGLLIPAIAGGE